jgi:TetR/AcrR family transcriptional regulator, tetracycline repressor protein
VKEPVKSRSGRRPRGSLSRHEVVETALSLADEQGLEALSMQALAARLGCGAMTIYRYVEDKDDLLDAIAERGLADLRLPRPLPAEVAAVLLAWGRALRSVLITHSSLPLIFLSHTVIGPGIFKGLEGMLGALARAGMPPSEGVHAIYAVLTFTSGFVAWELPRTRQRPESEYAVAWRRGFAQLRPEDFPLTGTVLDRLPRVAGEEQFELGLVSLVRGLTHTYAA